MRNVAELLHRNDILRGTMNGDGLQYRTSAGPRRDDAPEPVPYARRTDAGGEAGNDFLAAHWRLNYFFTPLQNF